MFCGRGDVEGSESDCFVFNIVYGDFEIFYCYVFRCKDLEKVRLFFCFKKIYLGKLDIFFLDGFVWCFNFLGNFVYSFIFY